MDEIKQKIRSFKNGTLSEKELLNYLKNFPFSREKRIKIDFHRKLRRGVPEAVYGRSKTTDQLKAIVKKFLEMNEPLLITKLDDKTARTLVREFPSLLYHQKAGIVSSHPHPPAIYKGKILIISGGAADEPVAEEAYVSSIFLGNRTEKEYDAGVACLSRILDIQPHLDDFSAVIVVAGMEGALPSVVAGMTSTPLIAVPTSIGYGANFSGISALLSMLNSCSGGVAVMNIDNGFGAAYQATLINRKVNQASGSGDD